MRIPILLTLLASLVLASCGWRDSRVNPRNWFGNSRDVPVDTGPDASVPIGTITELRIEPTPSGAIVYASGIADRQGAFRARLVPDTDDLSAVDGVLGFTLRVEYPRDATPVGSEFSRTVHEAYTLSSQTLAQVRTIRVSGERNAKESRRR
jgi:hypothetical protein